MYEELEAINFMLSHVGAAPVSTLTNPMPDVASAQLRLNESSIWVQKRGWWFNKLLQQTFDPDDTLHTIALPSNTLKIISSWPNFVIERKGFAYDPLRASDEFEDSICCDIVLKLVWDEMPGSAQDLIMYRAAQQMILHELEDANKANMLSQDIQQAFVNIAADDLQVKQRHAASTPAVQRFMRRIRPYRRSQSINPNLPGGNL